MTIKNTSGHHWCLSEGEKQTNRLGTGRNAAAERHFPRRSTLLMAVDRRTPHPAGLLIIAAVHSRISKLRIQAVKPYSRSHRFGGSGSTTPARTKSTAPRRRARTHPSRHPRTRRQQPRARDAFHQPCHAATDKQGCHARLRYRFPYLATLVGEHSKQVTASNMKHSTAQQLKENSAARR
jgi:hypothetical protein